MFGQQNKLKELFGKYGWELVESQVPVNFWVAEIWLLKSLWSPTDCYVFIEFEVDPMCEERKNKEQHVWAINISLKPPQDWQNNSNDIQSSDNEKDQITISTHFETRLSEIFDSLNNFRLKYNKSK